MAEKQNMPMPRLLGGIMIIAGTIIGAGMFANPAAMSGVWTAGSVLTLVFTWFFMFASGLMLMEATLHYRQGASFDTVIKDLLGQKVNIINGISVAFTLYTLTYAYITAGGGVITRDILNAAAAKSGADFAFSREMASIIMALTCAFFVWLSTKAVDRFCTLLIGGMIITFILMLAGLLPEIRWSVLADKTAPQQPYHWNYIFAALPVCLASFGFHGNVSSLTIYYRRDARRVAKSIFWGSMIALVLYILWQISVYGNLPRHEFPALLQAGGGVDILIAALGRYVPVAGVNKMVSLFAYMAIISSFLGVTLGLFDYLADLFKFADDGKGRLYTALITFAPPLLGSLFAPMGFVRAIGYVGLAASVWAVIVPAMAAYAARKRYTSGYRVFGGTPLIIFVIFAGCLNIFAHFANQFGWVKVFGM